MSLIADTLATMKKILFVSEQLDRLSADSKALAHTITDHEHRLIRIETTLEIAQRGSHRILPGK